MTILSFLEPFSLSMWLSILIAYVMVSLMIFFVARVSPYERYRSNSCPFTLSTGNKIIYLHFYIAWLCIYILGLGLLRSHKGNEYLISGEGRSQLNDNDAGGSLQTQPHIPTRNSQNENGLGFLNSFWFTITGFLLHSTTVNPQVFSLLTKL